MANEERTLVYHGTASDFIDIAPSNSGNLGVGFYVTDNPDAASEFAQRAQRKFGGNANIRPYYLQANCVLDQDNISLDELSRLKEAIPQSADELVSRYPSYPSKLVAGITATLITEDLADFHANWLGKGVFSAARLSHIMGSDEGFVSVLNDIYTAAGFDAVTRYGDALKSGRRYREWMFLSPSLIAPTFVKNDLIAPTPKPRADKDPSPSP